MLGFVIHNPVCRFSHTYGCWQADGFAANERVGVKADHRGLLCDDNVFELLKKWLGVRETTRRRMSKSKVMDLSPEGSC